MPDHQSRFIDSIDGLALHVRDYPGPGAATAVLCLHGLTRNSADFEDLAPHLATTRRVLAMDVRGRGRSGRDPDWRNYHLGSYVADAMRLLDAEGLTRIALIGTSMGGLISMMLAAERPQAVTGIVLNDIGPEIDPAGLARISGYVGKAGVTVSDWRDATEAIKAINGAAFPDLTDDEWQRFARRTFRAQDDGTLTLDYDPGIATAMAQGGVAPPDLWGVFGRLHSIPMLVLRGEMSDILSAGTVDKMAQRHPGLTAVTVPNRGHAPMLNEAKAVKAIDGFLHDLG